VGANAQQPAKAVAALEPFVGIWDTTGTIMGPDGKPAGELKATDTYEWFAGRFFLIHHVDGHMGDAEVKALEVIGAGPKGTACIARSYDNAGQSEEYEVALRGSQWTIDGKTQRFRGQLTEDGRILEGQWDLSEDGSTWRPWMRIRLRKR
jgi:hypothetical protein